MNDPAQPGEACTVEGDPLSGVDNCDLGSICWAVNDKNVGVCIEQCIGTPDMPVCAGVGDACRSQDSDVVSICIQSCDPFDSECDLDEVCVPVGWEFICLHAEGGGQLHEPCQVLNECASGLVCVTAEGNPNCEQNALGCCGALCDLSVKPDPDTQCTDQTCTPLFDVDPLPPGVQDIGVCRTPP